MKKILITSLILINGCRKKGLDARMLNDRSTGIARKVCSNRSTALYLSQKRLLIKKAIKYCNEYVKVFLHNALPVF